MSSPEPEATPTPTEVTPVPDPGPQPHVSNWSSLRTSLPPEVRDNPALDPYGTGDAPSGLPGLVKDFIGQQKLVGGDRVTKPGKDASVVDWDRYYGELGRPASHRDYDLGDYQAPTDMPWDPALQDALLNDLYDAGCSTAQANRILRSYTDRTRTAYRDIAQGITTDRDEGAAMLQREWGTAYTSKHELAERVFATAFPGDKLDAIAQMELADGTMVGDNPHFIRGMYELGRRMEEGTLVEGLAPSNLGMTPESAQVEINVMEGDPIRRAIMLDTNHPEHKSLMARHTALYAAANPEG